MTVIMILALLRRHIILSLAILALVSCASQPENNFNIDTLDRTLHYSERPTKLMFAAEQGDVLAMREALVAGAPLNAYNESGNAFALALKAGHYTIAEFLLKVGASFEQGFEVDEPSALMLASAEGRNDLVKQLIIKGAEIDHADSQGYTAAANAALNRHLTTLKILINAGAKVDADPQGKSILMHMVIDNNPLIVQQLIGAGADVNYRDSSGDTALGLARRAGYYDLDLMLIQAGARL